MFLGKQDLSKGKSRPLSGGMIEECWATARREEGRLVGVGDIRFWVGFGEDMLMATLETGLWPGGTKGLGGHDQWLLSWGMPAQGHMHAQRPTDSVVHWGRMAFALFVHRAQHGPELTNSLVMWGLHTCKSTTWEVMTVVILSSARGWDTNTCKRLKLRGKIPEMTKGKGNLSRDSVIY